MDTPEMEYEMFVLRAFGLAINGGKVLGRSDDPASMGNTDRYSTLRFNSLKATIMYSMEIYSSNMRDGLSDEIHEMVDGFLKKVIDAVSISEMTIILRDYQKLVVEKYFSLEKGIMIAR